jgi:hypothetical protein
MPSRMLKVCRHQAHSTKYLPGQTGHQHMPGVQVHRLSTENSDHSSKRRNHSLFPVYPRRADIRLVSICSASSRGMDWRFPGYYRNARTRSKLMVRLLSTAHPDQADQSRYRKHWNLSIIWYDKPGTSAQACVGHRRVECCSDTDWANRQIYRGPTSCRRNGAAISMSFLEPSSFGSGSCPSRCSHMAYMTRSLRQRVSLLTIAWP